MTKAEQMAERGYEDVVIFSEPYYEDALIGISTDGIAIYDYDKMVECLMEADNIPMQDAIDWIEYNTIRSLPYQNNAPIIIHRLDES